MRDLRAYSTQTLRRLIIGGLVILFLVGDGLIYFFYGKESAIMGLLCTAGGLIPVLMIWLILWGVQKVVERSKN